MFPSIHCDTSEVTGKEGKEGKEVGKEETEERKKVQVFIQPHGMPLGVTSCYNRIIEFIVRVDSHRTE